jgi:hypothetical protein
MLARVTAWGTVVVEGTWGGPFAGASVDELRLSDQGQLIIQSKVVVGSKSAAWKHVYNREDKWTSK